MSLHLFECSWFVLRSQQNYTLCSHSTDWVALHVETVLQHTHAHTHNPTHANTPNCVRHTPNAASCSLTVAVSSNTTMRQRQVITWLNRCFLLPFTTTNRPPPSVFIGCCHSKYVWFNLWGGCLPCRAGAKNVVFFKLHAYAFPTKTQFFLWPPFVPIPAST